MNNQRAFLLGLLKRHDLYTRVSPCACVPGDGAQGGPGFPETQAVPSFQPLFSEGSEAADQSLLPTGTQRWGAGGMHTGQCVRLAQ